MKVSFDNPVEIEMIVEQVSVGVDDIKNANSQVNTVHSIKQVIKQNLQLHEKNAGQSSTGYMRSRCNYQHPFGTCRASRDFRNTCRHEGEFQPQPHCKANDAEKGHDSLQFNKSSDQDAELLNQ